MLNPALGHYPDNREWELATMVRDRLLEIGYAGHGMEDIRKVSRRFTADETGSAKQDNEMADRVAGTVVRHWFWNANK